MTSSPKSQPNQVIAEIGSVHDGSYGNAKKLIALAKQCGADIVKFQLHISDEESLPNAPSPAYFNEESRREYFERIAFSDNQWRGLASEAAQQGIGFLVSPFSVKAVDILEDCGVDAYKVASGEVTNTPLLERIALTGKPVFLSSGMSNWDELDRAVSTLQDFCATTVLHCTSAYPCPVEQVGLNVIGEMRERWGLPVGFSDHTIGLAASLAAAAVGATVVEKHLTFSKSMYGSDAANAAEPAEFCNMVAGLREIWTMGQHPVDKDNLAPFADMKKVFEKSIVTARALPAGHEITREDLAFKKPGTGISAYRYQELLGRRIVKELVADHLLEPGDYS